MNPAPSWKPPGVKSTKKTGSVHSAAVMTTRAATFSAKIRTLSDFHNRIINQQQTPSSAEIITTLRYFQQTLVSFLKDIPSERSSLFKKYSIENVAIRSGLYPNLNYSGLFYGIFNLLDAFPIISSAQSIIAEAIIDTLKALYFFLDRECIEQLPLLLASQLGVFPSEVDRRLVHLLCDCIFPYSFGDGVNGQVSVPAVLILVLHHSVDNSLHSLIIERLAYRLSDLYNDLLKVIASGTSESRIAAVNLLFHYWPLLNPGIMLRKTVQYRVQAWSSPPCQNTQCVEKGPSTRLTYEPSICATLGDTAPPMFICNNCEKSISTTEHMPYLSQPLPALISSTCQNKGCSSSNRIAFGTCFDEDCIRSHGYIPLRLCEECFNALHPIENKREHIRHSGHSSVWGTQFERVMVEAIVKLLRETSSKLTELSADGESAKRPKWLRQLEGGRELGREIDPLSDERRMLSRFGIWLMVAHCPPVPEATSSSVGYLLGALFQWFSTTALLPNDTMGQTLEQLKADFGCEWLNQALLNHYEVFIYELLPPHLEPIYENIEDTIWDERFVRKEIMREGLSKLLALAPYDIISIDTWSRVMPYWLHSLNTDLVAEEDLLELKVPISKLFEPDLCALPFEPQRLYEFLAVRLQSNSYNEILKALDWLHLLSRIDIRISLKLLLNMFSNSLLKIPLPTCGELLIQNKDYEKFENESKEVILNGSELASSVSRENKLIEEEEEKIDENIQQTLEGPMSAQLVMTDILAQQIKLAGGASVMTCETLLEHLFSVIASLLEYQPEENFIKNGWPHSCRNPEGDQFADCLRCQQALFLYQVLLQVLEQFCPKEESRIDALTYGDETARDFADWLSEASSSLHQQQTTQGIVAGSNSPRPSLSPHALSTSSPHTFFGSPITQKRQQQQSVQKTSTPLIKAKQEVSTPSAEMVGALPTDDVDPANTQVAAFSFAEQSPLGMACVSATVIGLLQQQEAILAGRNNSETVEGEDKQKSLKIEQKEEQRLFWETSVGRFRFSLEQLPAQLRLTFVLLTNIEREPDPDVQFFLLSMLKYLFLHRECLLNARKEQEHRGFLVWIQENLLIPRLWSLLRSDYSHVGQMATPLILHAITLPLGDDVFWETVNVEFTSSEWERRLKAVDRVLVLAHFVPPNAVRNNITLLTSLSCAFSHLIVSMHDPNPAVAQKALLLLEALPRSSLTLICHCLEAQFDSCILDRPLIIARIHLLSVILPDESLFSWDFFIQRFETLALEAHLKSQQNAGADASMHFMQDLLHSDPMSDVYQRKVTRARQSLNEADNVRSIVRSLRENSLRHQLNPGVRGDQERRDAAQQVLRVCLRRGAVAGTTERSYGRSAGDMARLRLRKVLVLVRVVSAWREMAGRLLLPSSRRSSKMSHQSGGKDEGEIIDEQQQLLLPFCQLKQHQNFLELADQGLEDFGFCRSERSTIARRSLQATPPLLLPTLPQSRGSTTSSLALDLPHPLVQSTMSASSLSPRAIGSDSRYGRMREFTDEESNLCLLLNRVVDMQNPERHTVSLVVSLFVHFLANKRCGPADNAKKLSVLLRHFNALLGYSNSEKCFTIPPARLRRAAVCNAFLLGLPGVLDSNLLIGNQLLSIVLQLLLYLPSPQKFASDAPSADYSLRLLSVQQRHNWLNSIIIILYKYRCDSAPTNESIRKQMLIVVQTLEQQCHRCPISSQNQEQQQQNVPIAPENKERRSATCLLEAPGQDGQWSSSTEDSEVGNDSGVDELITNETLTCKIDSTEQLKEKRFASVDDEEMLKEHNGNELSSSTKNSLQQRPESLRILSIREHGGDSSCNISRKESTKTSVKGTDFSKTLDTTRPPVIALHPPTGIKRSRRPHSQRQQRSVRKQQNNRSNKPSRQRGASDFTKLCCPFCGGRLESFDEETLSLCCVALCTFLQRVPSLAAPLLQRTLLCTARFIDTPQFPWHETNIFVPGNAKSAAKQLIRIILHQLSGSGIALQLFNLHIQANELYSFWNKIALSLVDFNELNPVAFLQNLLEDIADSWPIRVTRILHNLATYIQFVPIEAISNWAAVVILIDGLYRRMHTQLTSESTNNTAIISNNTAHSVQNLMINNQLKQYRSELTILILSRILRIQGLATIKGAVQAIESFSKWLVEMLHKCPVQLCDLLAICTACNRGMIRERDKQIITRSVVSELLAALKFKCELAEENYLTIVRIVLQDFGESLGDDWINNNENDELNDFENNKKDWKFNYNQQQTDQYNTGAAEAIRPHVPELLEFIADMNVLAKLKKQFASNSDRVGGDLKAGLAQIIALEMSRPSVRDSRTVMRFIPWLYSPPSLAQALPNQFAESVANVRVLSWILLGSLHARGINTSCCANVNFNFQNNFQQQQQVNNSQSIICLPIPTACSNQMADYINFVLTGFADQSKQSVVHMSALFHAFHLCQLWTIYCEQTATLSRSEDMLTKTMQQLLDFWARVTPAILQLLSHSKVLADMVNLHFVNTLQALQQINSAVLCQLYPMWEPILTVNHAHVPRKLRLKFESVDAQIPLQNAQIRSWLSNVRYKISQIELQTSASSPFYNV